MANYGFRGIPAYFLESDPCEKGKDKKAMLSHNSIEEKSESLDKLKRLHDRNVRLGVPPEDIEFHAALLAALAKIKEEIAELRREITLIIVCKDEK